MAAAAAAAAVMREKEKELKESMLELQKEVQQCREDAWEARHRAAASSEQLLQMQEGEGRREEEREAREQDWR